MTTSDEADPLVIAHDLRLSVDDLAVEVSRLTASNERFRRLVKWLIAIALVAVIGTGFGMAGSVIAYRASNRATAASHRATDATAAAAAVAATAQAITDCINKNLGVRAIPTARDATAHITFAKFVLNLFSEKPATTPAEQKKQTDAALASVNLYVNELIADQAQRDANPVGKC